MATFPGWDSFTESVSEIPIGSIGYTIPGAIIGGLLGAGYAGYKNRRDPLKTESINDLSRYGIPSALIGALLGFGTDTLVNKYSVLSTNANDLLKKISRGH